MHARMLRPFLGPLTPQTRSQNEYDAKSHASNQVRHCSFEKKSSPIIEMLREVITITNELAR